MSLARSKRVLALGLTLALSAGTLMAVSETASAAAVDPVSQPGIVSAPWGSGAEQSSEPVLVPPPKGQGARIVNGTPADPAASPWMVQLRFPIPGSTGSYELCGGTLVTLVLVVTAAHCVADSQAAPTAYFGRANASSGGIAVQGIAGGYDPSYNPTTFDYDWGFIVLAQPVTAAPIKIAGPGETALWRPGRTGRVTGFGRTSDGGPLATALQQLTVPLLPDSFCGSASSYAGGFHSSTMLCGGYTRGEADTCQGDSGSGLTVPGDNGVIRLVGAVSFGTGCARPNFPGVYSRIADPAYGSRIQTLLTRYRDAYPSRFAASPDVTVLGSGAVPAGCTAAQSVFAPQVGIYATYSKALHKAHKAKKKVKKAKKKHLRHSRVHTLEKKAKKLKHKAKKYGKKKGGKAAAAAAAAASAACS